MLYVLFELTRKRKNLMEIVCVLQAFSISFSIAFVLKTDLYSTHFFGKINSRHAFLSNFI